MNPFHSTLVTVLKCNDCNDSCRRERERERERDWMREREKRRIKRAVRMNHETKSALELFRASLLCSPSQCHSLAFLFYESRSLQTLSVCFSPSPSLSLSLSLFLSLCILSSLQREGQEENPIEFSSIDSP